MTNEKKLVIKINCQSPNQQKNNVVKNQQQMITEWNIQRIAIAGLILLLVIVLTVSLLLMEDDKEIITVHDTAQSESINRNVRQQNKEHEVITANNIEQANIKADSYLQKNKNVSEDKPLSASEDTGEPDKGTETNIKSKSVAKDSARQDEKQQSNKLANGLARAQLTNSINNKEPAGKVELPIKVDKKYAKGIFYFTELRGLKGKTVYHEWVYKGNLIYKRRINILGNRWRASTRKMMQYKSIGPWQVKLVDEDGVLMHDISFEVVE